MLTFKTNKYKIIVEATNGIGKEDLAKFDAVYINSLDFEFPSMQNIKMYSEDHLLTSVLLGSIGGGTGVCRNTALLDNDRLVTCCADTVFCLSVDGLKLLWKRQADLATCFAIYQFQQDYIVHGELEISRLDRLGNMVWSVSGADIFVTIEGDSNIILSNDCIFATDFEYSKYVFDYDGKTISYTKANK